jgi:hypothetical protein
MVWGNFMPTVSAVGKPTVFFSAHHSDKQWRQKEKVVAIIESSLQGIEEPLTFSPAHVQDIIGATEEVDVAFGTSIDPLKPFSFVEVRDRNANVRRPYIQQVKGKRDSLGIERSLVVSTKGFSPNALKLAQSFDIPTRLLLPTSKESIHKWFIPNFMELRGPIFNIVHYSAAATRDDVAYKFEDDKNAFTLLTPRGNGGTLVVVDYRTVFNVDFRNNETYRAGVSDHLASVPDDGLFHRLEPIVLRYLDRRLYLVEGVPNPEIDQPVFQVEALVFFVEVSTYLRADIGECYQYLNPANNEVIAEAFLSSFEVGEESLQFCLVRTFGDDTDRITGCLFT